MKYTKPRALLKANETELFDMMVRTSVLLRQTADGGILELHDILKDLYVDDAGDLVALERATEGLHAMLCYAFTCGVAFAVDQQVKNAVAVVDRMKKN